MRIIRVCSTFSIRVLPILAVLAICISAFFAVVPSAHASINPHVPGCLPWIAGSSTNGPLIVDLEEDNCNGYYTIVFFNNLSSGNFHAYVVTNKAADNVCLNVSSCRTSSAGYGTNSNHQVCYYGEGGPPNSTYEYRANGCIVP